MSCYCPIVDGVEANQFFFKYTKNCFYDPMDMAGYVCGMINIGFWLCAQLPQVYKSYKTKRPESLSITFLLLWLVGDSTNLFGCIFANQTQIQLITAIYFVGIDLVMIGQYVWYMLLCKKKYFPSEYLHASTPRIGTPIGDAKMNVVLEPESLSEVFSENRSDSFSSIQRDDQFEERFNPSLEEEKIKQFQQFETISPFQTPSPNESSQSIEIDVEQLNQSEIVIQDHSRYFIVLAFLVVSLSAQVIQSSIPSVETSSDSPKKICGKLNQTLFQRIFGDVCAWISGIAYFVAKIPQTVHIYKKKNVDSISIYFFQMLVFANLFYGLAVFLPGVDFSDPTFYEATCAYLIGSFCVLPICIFNVIQYYYYKYIKDWWEKKKELTKLKTLSQSPSSYLITQIHEDDQIDTDSQHTVN